MTDKLMGDLAKSAMADIVKGHTTYELVLLKFKQKLMSEALVKTYGNQAEAARLFGINRHTIRTTIGKKP